MDDKQKTDETLELLKEFLSRQNDDTVHIKEESGIRFTWPMLSAFLTIIVAAASFYFSITNQLNSVSGSIDEIKKGQEQMAQKADLKDYVSKGWMREYIQYDKDNNPSTKVPSVEHITRLSSQ